MYCTFILCPSALLLHFIRLIFVLEYFIVLIDIPCMFALSILYIKLIIPHKNIVDLLNRAL